ncbi:MAG: hypothetical protein AAF654_13345 [Myxococcota bacterium]
MQTDKHMNDNRQAWNRAGELVETLHERTPKEASILVSALRADLGLDADTAPLDADVAIRIELAAAIYFEIDGRHGESIRSYNQLLRWYEMLGPVNEAHVDGLISGFGWSVLNEQTGAHRRFERVIEEAIERLETSDATKAAFREWVRIWREKAAENANVEPVVDYERFAEARDEFEVDEVTLDELESHSLTQIWSTLNTDSDWQETYRKLSVVLGEMGFMQAVEVANEALSNEEPDPGVFSASLTSAFSTARRQLAA